MVPPDGFEPLKASEEQLEKYGFPPKPSDDSADYAEWYEMMKNYKGTVTPEISVVEKDATESLEKFQQIRDSSNSSRTSGDFYAATNRTSLNWSGYVSDLGDSSTKYYIQAKMQFTQPTISSIESGKTNLNSYWIGFGGFNGSQKLVQAGTSTLGLNNHRAWFEYLSSCGGQTVSMQFIDSLNIRAGDTIYVYISFQKANNLFNYYISNNTTGYTTSDIIENLNSSTQFDGTCVEWIVERCSSGNTPLSLGNYGTVTLYNCKTTLNTSTSTWLNLGSLSNLYKITMKNGSRTLSAPGSISTERFTCTWSNYS